MARMLLERVGTLSRALFLAAIAVGVLERTADAQTWTQWATSANGVVSGTFPVIAVAPAPKRDIFYSSLIPPSTLTTGKVWRAKVDATTPGFTPMPDFPLPTPAAGQPYRNVFTMTTNKKGEPIVGLSANGRSDNTDPMLMTWDESAGKWFAPPVSPSSSVCAHNLYRVERSPNGDIWAICQWHGAYKSTDDGKTFQYVDASAILAKTAPAYFPTRSAGTADLGALYSLGFGREGRVFIGTETGGVVTSVDNGAPFAPVDWDWTNTMSTMARMTNCGNAYGVGVSPDGKHLVVQAFPSTTGYPAADSKRLYAVDLTAHTVTVASGIPDYWMGGRVKVVTVPSGTMFFHSNHDSVNTTTGAAQPGGILRTNDNGLTWVDANAGISEIATFGGSWFDNNGRGAGDSLAVDGTDVYTATTNAKIFRLSTGTVSPSDSGLPDTFVPDTFVADTFVPDTTVADTAIALDTFTPDAVDDAMVSDSAQDTESAMPSDSAIDSNDASVESSLTPEEGGCACRASARRGSTGALGFLIALLVTLRRPARGKR